MFLSNASIRRPIAMSCLIIGLTLLGFNAYRKMGLEAMPKVDLPFITVVTIYPGASPSQIETDIAKRIEDQMVSLDGLKHVSSACMENVCQTMLEFHLGVDVDIAATDVREKLDLIKNDFPGDVEDPKILKFDINAKPIISLALTGDLSVEELYDFADNTLRDRITVLSGVADVDLIGGAKREVHVTLDREKLAARSLSSLQVVQALQEGIRKIPSGRVREGKREFTVEFDADFVDVSDIETLEVANEAGQRCYVKDIGAVSMTTEELRQMANIDGRPCIAIKVVKKSDANAVWVVDRVKAAMTKLQASLPGGMELIWVSDDGTFTEALASSAWINVAQGILLTAGILFLFLYNLRTLLIIGVTMPLTIIIGLFFMQSCGFTLNSSTLIALGMSVGILVTNSIVVLESIAKFLEKTGDPKEAARRGAGEAGIAVLASAGTNVVVLFPMAMMGSLIGLWIRPFALTMLIMTVVSLFISFTLTPILCSLLLKPIDPNSRSLLRRMEQLWNRLFDRIIALYRAILEFTERHRLAAVLLILLVIGLFIHSLWVGSRLGNTMSRNPDRGEIAIKLEYPTEYNLVTTRARVMEIEKRLKDLPELKHILTTLGKVEGVIGQSSEGVYLAQMNLKFSERTERKQYITDLVEVVRERLTGITDTIITVSMPAVIGGQGSDIEMNIAGDDLEELEALALKAAALSQAIPGMSDVDTTVRSGKPRLRLLPKRPVLSDLGIAPVNIGLALRGNLEGLDAGTYRKGDRNYDIVVKFSEEEGKRQVQDFLLPAAPGHPVLMTNVTEIEESRMQVQITRRDKRRVTKLFANLTNELPLGDAVKLISQALEEKAGLPPGYEYSFSGDYEYMNEGQEAFGEAGLIALILVVLTLAAILESFRQPIIILATLPLGLVGMLWALSLTGMTVEIFVIMGGVMLIGIVVNNAILIMDQFNIHVKEGVPRHRAMITASCERFRPIVMITLAAVLGMLPMAFGRGIGAEWRNAVGIASAGGILVSGALTVFVIPVLYDLFTRKAKPAQVNSKEKGKA